MDRCLSVSQSFILAMLTAEERRQRILERGATRLQKLRDVNRSDDTSDLSPMAPVSSLAPANLLQKPLETPEPTVINTPPPLPSSSSSSGSSLLSTITSATNMMNKFTSSSKPQSTPEVTKETILIDKQHILILILGILVGILYSFYLSSQSNFFFLIYFTTTACLLTSRYYMMEMKQRSNVLITTAMLSGWRPDLMKQFLLIYTLLVDAWIIFALYFGSFCLTHVICSLL